MSAILPNPASPHAAPAAHVDLRSNLKPARTSSQEPRLSQLGQVPELTVELCQVHGCSLRVRPAISGSAAPDRVRSGIDARPLQHRVEDTPIGDRHRHHLPATYSQLATLLAASACTSVSLNQVSVMLLRKSRRDHALRLSIQPVRDELVAAGVVIRNKPPGRRVSPRFRTVPAVADPISGSGWRLPFDRRSYRHSYRNFLVG